MIDEYCKRYGLTTPEAEEFLSAKYRRLKLVPGTYSSVNEIFNMDSINMLIGRDYYDIEYKSNFVEMVRVLLNPLYITYKEFQSINTCLDNMEWCLSHELPPIVDPRTRVRMLYTLKGKYRIYTERPFSEIAKKSLFKKVRGKTQDYVYHSCEMLSLLKSLSKRVDNVDDVAVILFKWHSCLKSKDLSSIIEDEISIIQQAIDVYKERRSKRA